jgi:hypothetical protein
MSGVSQKKFQQRVINVRIHTTALCALGGAFGRGGRTDRYGLQSKWCRLGGKSECRSNINADETPCILINGLSQHALIRSCAWSGVAVIAEDGLDRTCSR